MDLRIKIDITDPGFRIGYDDSVMLIGSCFTDEIGSAFHRSGISVSINPFGVQYNPYSIAETLETIISGKKFINQDLYYYNNKYLSFRHDTGFSSPDKRKILQNINTSLNNAEDFLQRSSVLIVTFGTSWYYRWKESGAIVANCHKIPEARFIRELADLDSLVERWKLLFKQLADFNKHLKIILTISPVRHLKDGAHGNQVSKSILQLLVNALENPERGVVYFPSYEIVLDELRDYRFYKDDMIHPSEKAIEYIWERFCESFFTRETRIKSSEISKISGAMDHRINSADSDDIMNFAESMLKKIRSVQKKYPDADLSKEIKYFQSMTGNIK